MSLKSSRPQEAGAFIEIDSQFLAAGANILTMRKRAGLAVTAFAVACLLVMIALLYGVSRQNPEPACNGKTLAQWLVLLDSDPTHKAENDAAETAITTIGPKALPVLVRILQLRPPSPFFARASQWAVRLHLLRAQMLSLQERQYRAARACCLLSEVKHFDISPAIPELAYHFTNNPSDRLEPFAWGLVFSGLQGLSIVTNAMAKDPSYWVREQAARALWITPRVRTPEVATALLAATSDSNVEVRVTAILSLESFVRQQGLDALIVPGVMPCLQDTNNQVRKWTVDLLSASNFDPVEQRLVVSALTNALADSDSSVRQAIERNLGRLGKEPGMAVPALIAQLGSTSAAEFVTASRALMAFGSNAAPALEPLLHRVRDPDPAIQTAASEALRYIDTFQPRRY